MKSKERFYWDAKAVHPEVTGSCHVEEVNLPNGKKIQFAAECGLFQEKKYERLNKILPFNVEETRFVLVTHNHIDHTGRLPFVVKNGFRGKIYTSKDTTTLMPLALEDCQNVLSITAKNKNERVLFSRADVRKTLELTNPCSFYETIEPDENVKVTFLKNGHLVGAAMILVQVSYPGYEDINFLFTGDYNNNNIFFDVPPIPEWVLELPLNIVMESTYGYMDSTSVKRVFKDNVLECINNGGTAVLPAYSLESAQKKLYHTKVMQDSGDLSTSIPVYLDGQYAQKYTYMYSTEGLLDIKPEMRNFLPQNLTFADKTMRKELLEDYREKIIIATSGGGDFGPAQTYISRYLSRENSLIQFLGYVTPDSLGGRLKNAKYGENIRVGGMITKKCARVEYSLEDSAHTKRDGAIAFLKQFKNLKAVRINHGQKDVQKEFANIVNNEVHPKNVCVMERNQVYRFNPYGLVKSFSIN